MIRPGRVDVKAPIDYASEYQIQQMYHRFYPEQPVEKSLIFAKRVSAQETSKKNISMAQIQGYFMCYKSEPNAALENVEELWTV